VSASLTRIANTSNTPISLLLCGSLTCTVFTKVSCLSKTHKPVSTDTHKVSDVFHHGTPDATLWEFKHGNGNFKRGDLVGLREIKRRASRHALVHRGEYPNQKPPPSQPGTPAEPMPQMQEGGDPRLNGIDHTLYELNARLQRYEENAQFMHIKHQAIVDTVLRLLQFNSELSRAVLALAPSPDNPIHRDGK
jgi:hypothetical protein